MGSGWWELGLVIPIGVVTLDRVCWEWIGDLRVSEL
jgi:hypothetical protein